MQEASSRKCQPLPATPRLVAFRAEAENLTEEQRRMLEELGLYSTRHLEEKLRLLLRRMKEESQADPPRSLLVIVSGFWGQGKSHVGSKLLPRLAGEVGLAYSYVSFEDLLDKAREKLGERADRTSIRREIEGFLLKTLEESNDKPVVVFVDELEAFLEGFHPGREKSFARRYVEELVSIAKGLMQGTSKSPSPLSGLAGRIHLVLAVTPEADAALRSLLREKGIEGRLYRRVETIQLHPLTKLDTLRVLRAVLHEYHGIPEDHVPVQLTNTLYLVSGGNMGLLLRLLNEIAYEAYLLCKEIHGRDCVCSLRDPYALLEVLSRVTIPYSPGSQQGGSLVDHTVVEKVRRLVGETGLAETAISMLFFLEPLPPGEEYRAEEITQEVGVGLTQVAMAYGSLEEIRETVTQVLRRLRGRADEIILRTIVEALVTVLGGGEAAITLPRRGSSEISELELLLLGLGVREPRELLYEVIEAVHEETDKSQLRIEERIHVPLSHLWRVFPSLLGRIVPFISCPEKSITLYRHVQEIKRSSPDEYYSLLITGMKFVLYNLGMLRRGENAEEYLVVENIYDTRYLVPAAFSEKHVDTEKPLLQLIPRTTITEGSRKLRVMGAQIRVEIGLGAYDANLLATLGYLHSQGLLDARSNAECIDGHGLLFFLNNVREKIFSQDVFREAANRLVEKGIAVPYLLPSGGRVKDKYSIVDFYRALLLGGAFIEPRELAEKLYMLYSIRPYRRGTQQKWCKIPVPGMLSVDLEPDDYRAYYDEQKRRQFIEEKLVREIKDFLETAESLGLVGRGDRGYVLRLHPVTARIKRILREKGEIGLEDLLTYFVFPEPQEQRGEAIRLLKTFFLQFLIARGEAQVVKTKIRYRERRTENLVALYRHFEEEFERKVQSPLRKTLGECGLREDDVDNIVKLAIFKERGVKLVGPSRIRAVMTALSHTKLPDHLVEELDELVRGYTTLFSSIAVKLGEARKQLEDEANGLQRTYNEIARRLKGISTKPFSTASPPLEVTRLTSKFCKLVQQSIAEEEKLVRKIVRTPPSKISSEFPELRSMFFYENCDNEYAFSLFLYIFRKEFEKTVREIGELKRRLEEVNKEFSSVLERAKRESCLEEARSEVERVLEKKSIESVGDLVRYLGIISEKLKPVVEKCEECRELRDSISSVLRSMEDIYTYDVEAEVGGLLSLLEHYTGELEKLRDVIGPNYDTIVEELEEARKTSLQRLSEIAGKIERIIGDIESIDKELESITCSDMDRLRRELQYLQRLREDYEEAVREAERIRSSITDGLEKVARIVEREALILENQLAVLKKLSQAAQVDVTSIHVIGSLLENAERSVEKLRKAAQSIKRREAIGISLSRLVREAQQHVLLLRSELRKLVERDLGETGYRVLELLYSMPRGRETRLSGLVEEIARRTGLDGKEVVLALLEIDRRGYWRIVVSS